MTCPAIQQAELEAEKLGLPIGKSMIFSTTHTKILIAVIEGRLDPRAMAREQPACHGLDRFGTWVGFQKAAEEHGLMDIERTQAQRL